MFLVPFFDLQNFILLVRTVPFLRKIIFISSYIAKNNYFLLYELIQDLPYAEFRENKILAKITEFTVFNPLAESTYWINSSKADDGPMQVLSMQI